LCEIASRILAIPSTSASVERIFAKHGRIHTKDRNKLLNSRVERLLTVQTHYQSKNSNKFVENNDNSDVSNSDIDSDIELIND